MIVQNKERFDRKETALYRNKSENKENIKKIAKTKKIKEDIKKETGGSEGDPKDKEIKALKEELGKVKEENKILLGRCAQLQDLAFEKYLKLQKILHDIETCRPYVKFFEKIAYGLQILLGMGETTEVLSEKQQRYYLENEIIEKLAEAMNGWKVVGWDLIPEEKADSFNGKEIETETRKKIRDGKIDDLLEDIQKAQITVRQKEIALRKKCIVQKMENLKIEIEKMGTNFPVDEKEINKLAGKVNEVLKQQGIHPMYADDGELADNEKLRERFTSNKSSIRYPGLFIRQDDAWEVLGAYIGNDLVKEKENTEGCAALQKKGEENG